MIFVKLLQLENELSSILVTLSGIVMVFKLLQPLNVFSLINSTPLEIVILVKLEQLWNELSPIYVTLSGIIMLFKLEQLRIVLQV